MNNVKNLDSLKKKYKDDPDYKDHPEMAHVGIDADNIFITHEELMGKPLIPIEFIFHPILPKAGYVLFHAEAGIGKTYFCLNIAYAIAQGGRFLKFAAPQPKKVLYIDAELGEEAVRRRIDTIHKKQGDLFFNNLDYIFYDKFPNGNIPKIDTEAGRNFYTKHILKHKYEGVFLDNLLNLSATDLNKANEWHAIQEWIKMFRKKGIFFFLIHHSSSDVTKQLGTCARITIANTVISLQHASDENDQKNKIKVVYQKTRDFYGKEADDFYAINNLDGTFSVEEMASDFEKLVLTYWQRGLKEMKINEAINKDGIKCYPNKVYRAIDKLRREGVIGR